MSIGLVGAMGGGGPPGVAMQNDPNSANNSNATQAAAVGGSANAPIGGSVKTETNQAVQTTPASTSAVKIDIGTERTAADGEIKYPISGPDQFAKTMAVRNQAPEPVVEERPAELVAEEPPVAPGVSETAADRNGAERANPGEDRKVRETTVEQQDQAKRADLAEARTEKRSDDALVLEDAQAA